MACSSHVFNRKVALVLAALSVYGLLTVFVSSDSMSPKFLIASFKSRYLAVFDVTRANVTRNVSDITRIVTPEGGSGKRRGNVTSRGNFTTVAAVTTTRNLTETVIISAMTMITKPSIGFGNVTKAIVGLMLSNLTGKTSGGGLNATTATKTNDSSVVATITRSGSNYTVSTANITRAHGTGLTTLQTSVTLPSPRHSGAATAATTAQPLITLFTTVRNSPDKAHIYHNTIRNWRLLHPWVKPILYTISGELDLTDFAHAHGWDVLPVPATSRAGVPILRHMFLDAQKRVNSTFYGYVNGDILFTQGLVDTLKAILRSATTIKQMLVVGRRTNFKLAPHQNITSLAEVALFGKKGELFTTNAQDYFITTRNGYPWGTIPDFVVGRVGYDNWLVVTALVRRMYTIDTSKTLLALHQTGTDGNYAGHRKKPKGDTYINYGLAGKRFDYSLGHVSCGQFFTEGAGSNIKVLQRSHNGCERSFKKYHVSPYLSLKPPWERMML